MEPNTPNMSDTPNSSLREPKLTKRGGRPSFSKPSFGGFRPSLPKRSVRSNTYANSYAARPRVWAARGKYLAAVGLVVLAIGAGFGGGWVANRHYAGTTGVTAAQSRQVVSSEGQLISQIAK